jgi:transposase
VHDGTGRRPSILDDHKPYLRQRWNAGCTDAAVLHRELRARGYQGGYSLIRDYLSRFRGTVMPAPAKAVPKTRAVTRWIMTGPASLAHADQAQLDAILQACPELAAVTTCVRGFAAMMTGRRGRDLEKGMTAATATGDPGLRSFITGLRSDQDAVTAALTLPWSSGAVEGHVNRIKMLKRQMYGRARPDLLRRRVLMAD